MRPLSHIPPNLAHLQLRPAYIVTYYGDIHYGSLWECQGYRDGFFIIPKSKIREAQILTSNNAPVEKFRELGIEIKDHRVIAEVIRDKSRFGTSDLKTIHNSGQRFSRMFVFGAAASTFCVFGEEAKAKFRAASYNPPTGFEIFNAKYNACYSKYPATKQIIPEFELRGNDIEACMNDEWCEYRDFYRPDVTARHINIQFYLQDLFGSLSDEVIKNDYRYNLYNLFCRKLCGQLAAQSGEVAAIVSFNYDTILDHYIESFSAPFDAMDDYFDWHNRNVILFKPHGSANWGWRFTEKVKEFSRDKLVKELLSQRTEPWQIYYNLLGDMRQTVESTSWGMEGKYSLNKDLIRRISASDNQSLHYPALLLPYRDKDEFVMPYQMQHALTQCFNGVSELFLIGWKGNEEVFNARLKTHAHGLRKITIVNPKAAEVRQNLERAGFDLSRYEVNELATLKPLC